MYFTTLANGDRYAVDNQAANKGELLVSCFLLNSTQQHLNTTKQKAVCHYSTVSNTKPQLANPSGLRFTCGHLEHKSSMFCTVMTLELRSN